MMNKILMLLIGGCVLCWGCGEKGPGPGEVAAQTAKVYYEYLLQGKYDQFVDGRYQPDSIPDTYREQLITNARMFAGQMNDEHQGLKAVHVANGEADTARHVANAFLVFTYGDKTTEEVVVPMVEREGVWYMR